MKKRLLLSAFLILMILIQSHAQNTWTQRVNFPLVGREGAAGFSIGDKGYIGTGFYLPDVGNNDFWEYDFTTNTWTQKADVGKIRRGYATGFSIGNKGYIGMGEENKGTDGFFYEKDFWEYDPNLNTWTRKADFKGGPRGSATGFSMNGKGYVGTGFNGRYFKDFWEYDPSTDTWTRKADFGGSPRVAVGFSIGNKGYIGTGYSYNGQTHVYSDFWEYNPQLDLWRRKADFGGGSRGLACGFSVAPNGYIGCGLDENNNFYKDFWEYDPVMNKWKEKAKFPGVASIFMVGLSIGNYGYFGTGETSSGGTTTEFWQYTPDDLTKESQKDSGLNCVIFPNPGNGRITLQANLQNKAQYVIKVFNEEGQLKWEIKGENSSSNFSKQLDLTSLPSGNYILQLIHNGRCETKELTIEN